MSSKFIDISEHNTILSIDTIGQHNLKGCIMKATEGTTYIDHACDILYDAIHGQLPIGFYHYLTSTSEPETQAQNFWNKIRDKDYQILPIIDVEQESLGYKAQSYSERFISEFYKLSGQNMIIYSGRCYIEEKFDVSFRNENIWWVADYGRNNTPSILGCKVIAWQYTDSSRDYPFNNGDLDVSILIDEDYFYIDKLIEYSEETSIQTQKLTSIFKLQTELNHQGFKDKNGKSLVVDGIAGELTLSACPIVKSGANGGLTEWIQCKLMELDIMGDKANDTIFGEQTRQAVITFQEKHSLIGDGIVGKNTWRKLLGL